MNDTIYWTLAVGKQQMVQGTYACERASGCLSPEEQGTKVKGTTLNLKPTRQVPSTILFGSGFSTHLRGKLSILDFRDSFQTTNASTPLSTAQPQQLNS